VSPLFWVVVFIAAGWCALSCACVAGYLWGLGIGTRRGSRAGYQAGWRAREAHQERVGAELDRWRDCAARAPGRAHLN
jgi:hypothetical protein